MSGAEVTLYHNPACGTSRTTLALIRAAGIEPVIVEYLKAPPDHATLRRLLAEMGIGPRELLRTKERLHDELDLGADRWTDDQLIAQMIKHPVLINRPIVRTPKGTRLCRPADLVGALLP